MKLEIIKNKKKFLFYRKIGKIKLLFFFYFLFFFYYYK